MGERRHYGASGRAARMTGKEAPAMATEQENGAALAALVEQEAARLVPGAASRLAARKAREAARLGNEQEAALASIVDVLAPVARKRAASESRRSPYSITIEAGDVEQEAALAIVTRLRAGETLASVMRPAEIGREAARAASAIRRRMEKEAPAGDALDVVKEERALAGEDRTALDEASERQRRAVLGKRGRTTGGPHRADVYGVGEAARLAMRDPFDVWAHEQEARALDDAMASEAWAPSDKRPAEQEAWALARMGEAGDAWALAVDEELTLAVPLASGPLSVHYGAVVDMLAPGMAPNMGDVLGAGYRPLVLARYRTTDYLPGDVKQWRRMEWATVAPSFNGAARAALGRAARAWAADMRAATRCEAKRAEQEAARQRAAEWESVVDGYMAKRATALRTIEAARTLTALLTGRPVPRNLGGAIPTAPVREAWAPAAPASCDCWACALAGESRQQWRQNVARRRYLRVAPFHYYWRRPVAPLAHDAMVAAARALASEWGTGATFSRIPNRKREAARYVEQEAARLAMEWGTGATFSRVDTARKVGPLLHAAREASAIRASAVAMLAGDALARERRASVGDAWASSERRRMGRAVVRFLFWLMGIDARAKRAPLRRKARAANRAPARQQSEAAPYWSPVVKAGA